MPALSEKQARFLHDEFGMSVSAGDTLKLDPEKREELFMALLMIECDEAELQGGMPSSRRKTCLFERRDSIV